MKSVRVRDVILGGLVMASLIVGASAESPDPVITELIELHNRERAKEKLPPLTADSKLTEAALLHASDMAKHEKMTHEGSDGSKPFERIQKQGCHFRKDAENVAFGQREPGEAIREWMESPSHRKNILGDFTNVGAAVAQGEDGRRYWCVDFGTAWPRFEPAEAAKQVVEAINQERAKAKLPPLKSEPRLEAVAQGEALALAEQDAPKKDKGDSIYQKVEQKGYQFKSIVASLASGEPTPADAVKSMMDRPELKENVLGNFSDIGVGYAIAADDIPHWCFIFSFPSR